MASGYRFTENKTITLESLSEIYYLPRGQCRFTIRLRQTRNLIPVCTVLISMSAPLIVALEIDPEFQHLSDFLRTEMSISFIFTQSPMVQGLLKY